jgi:hypothetical protein
MIPGFPSFIHFMASKGEAVQLWDRRAPPELFPGVNGSVCTLVPVGGCALRGVVSPVMTTAISA